MKLNIKKFGLATALTGVLLYIACLLVMLLLGQEGTVKLFNGFLHGLDTSSIIRMDVPLWEAVIGIIQTFILSWMVGACIAMIYNWQFKEKAMG